MKKYLLVLLALALMLSMTACGKSEAAQAADDLIAAIGTVTLDSAAAIEAAEDAVAALSDKEKDTLENTAQLREARETYDDLAEAEAARIAALEELALPVSEAIAALQDVTLDSAAAITAARAAYDALEAEAQAYVTNYDLLTGAEATLQQLQVANAIALIDAIGTVTVQSRPAIDAAQAAYDALAADAQAQVTNAALLGDAAAALQTLLQAEAERLLNTMYLENDVVRNLKFYYPKAFPRYDEYWGADVRCFVLPYMGMQGDSVWLRLVCDYTADDWVFFEKITFAVDDQRFYKFFSYFDVTRDNGGGDVWEYVDIEVNDAELELLRAIANSQTTIVRFEGDDYSHDFTVSDKDKEAILQMLTVYDALRK